MYLNRRQFMRGAGALALGAAALAACAPATTPVATPAPAATDSAVPASAEPTPGANMDELGDLGLSRRAKAALSLGEHLATKHPCAGAPAPADEPAPRDGGRE